MMVAKNQHYPEYKDSGVDFENKIPSNWSVEKLRYIGEFTASGIDKKVIKGQPLVKIVNYTDIYGNESFVLNDNADFMVVSCDESKINRHQIVKGDLLFTPSSETVDEIGISCLINSDFAKTSFSYHVIRLHFRKRIFHDFKKYLCNNEFVLNQFSKKARGTTRQTLGRDDFKSTIVFLPTFQEQKQIANFLDHETAKIDQLIEKQQKLIQILKEKRQAVISHAVSKGLNPDTPMKDSDVEWLGKVPKHWEMVPLKYLCKFYGGGTPSKEILSYWVDGNIPWVSPKDMKVFRLVNSRDKITISAVEQSSTNYIKPGALLMVVRSGILQNTIPIAINQVRVTINQDMKALSFNERVGVDYVAFYILGYTPSLLLEWSKEGATVESIEQEYLSSSLIPVPPLNEQRKIVKMLDKQIDFYNKLEKKSLNTIKLLRERRSALISSAVTGKIDVRKWNRKRGGSANE
jgi:type I restriction enzyme S subunit